MPEVDLRMFDMFVRAPGNDPLVSVTSYDSMLPAMNSMTVHGEEANADLVANVDLAVSSADWTEEWARAMAEEGADPNADKGHPNYRPSLISPSTIELFGRGDVDNSPASSPAAAHHIPLSAIHENAPTDDHPVAVTSPGYLGEAASASYQVKASSHHAFKYAPGPSDADGVSHHRPVPRPAPTGAPGHRRSSTTGMINVSDLLDGPAKDGWMSLGANVPVHLNQGIADTVVHPSRPRRVKTDDELEGYDHKSGRGKYRCGRCGQPKVNHDCPFVADISTRSTSTQVEKKTVLRHNHPFLTERTISIRGKQHQLISQLSRIVPPSVRVPPAPIHVARPAVSSYNEFSAIRILHPSMVGKSIGASTTGTPTSP
jgi:hypothetical protein